MNLLSRDDFKTKVFQRDNYSCVICNAPAVDAHHILDRKLFSDGGYYLNNGASVCADHHFQCETTEISVKQIREACGIKEFCLPDYLELDQEYDKWANPILSNKQRLKGPMFNEPNVQKILGQGNFLSLFTDYDKSPKYNRTFHVPWSKGATNDDKIADDLSKLINCVIIITEKMDGSNVSLEHESCFARTHSGPPTHKSFDLLKVFHSGIKYKISEGVQLFGEWCYALHSIAYSQLPDYFMMFNVRYVEKSVWASWDEVVMWSEEIGVPTVPVLFKGIAKSEIELKSIIENLMKLPSNCGGLREGVVVRRFSEFSDRDFSKMVMKCVRANHVQTTTHWKNKEIIKNKKI